MSFRILHSVCENIQVVGRALQAAGVELPADHECILKPPIGMSFRCIRADLELRAGFDHTQFWLSVGTEVDGVVTGFRFTHRHDAELWSIATDLTEHAPRGSILRAEHPGIHSYLSQDAPRLHPWLHRIVHGAYGDRPPNFETAPVLIQALIDVFAQYPLPNAPHAAAS